MSDARWIDIAADFAAAASHFRNSAALYDLGGLDGSDLDGYRARMAFMHAMLAGHTSLESGLVRILELIGEERPAGNQWQADLIRRAGLDRPGVRPAILDGELTAAGDRTRRFRHVAVRAYDSFDQDEVKPAVEAARKLADRLSPALEKISPSPRP